MERSGSWTETYRPETLDHVVGQPTTVKTLKVLARMGGLDGGLIFQGPTGTGKTTTARALARTLGVDMFWDYHEVKASECSVSQVREIARNVLFAPHVAGGRRVWLIDEAHRMSSDAFDAWKTVLEDLPARRTIIFATTDTVRMARETAFRHRCQVFDFAPADADATVGLLQWIADAEGVPASVDVAEIAEASEGSYRQAVKLLQRQAALAAAGLDAPLPSARPALTPAQSERTVQTCGDCGVVAPIHARGLCVTCYNKSRRVRAAV